MPTLRLFATVRVAAGTGRDVIDGDTVEAVIDNAISKYGQEFESLVPICRIWVNGQSAGRSATVSKTDEIALLPPVSGG